jgi:effector-binding domain-containing protein
MSFQVQVKQIPPQQILSITRHALQKDLQAHLDGGIKTLIVYAQSESVYGQAKDIRIAGLPFAIYHARASVDNILAEICLPVEGSIEPTKEIAVKELPSVEVAFTSTTLRQSVFPGVVKAYQAIEQWLSNHNHQQAGPPREIYLNYDHSIFSAAAKWEDPCLEIAWPCQPPKV